MVLRCFRHSMLRFGVSLVLTVSLLVSHSPFASAQSQQEIGLPFVRNYPVKGLNAGTQVWSVIEDDRGFMYFGLQSAIIEYDGINWRAVATDGKQGSVSRAMVKDKDGRIYYGAVGDFGYLDKDSLGQMKAFSLLSLVPEKERNFFDIWSVRATPEGIYFQSRDALFRYDRKKGIKVWKPTSQFMHCFYPYDEFLIHDRTGGILRMKGDQLVPLPGLNFSPTDRVRVMLPFKPAPDGSRQYLLGTFYSGLLVYDGKTLRKLRSDPRLSDGSAITYAGERLPNGQYILGTTGNGLFILDSNAQAIRVVNRSSGMMDEAIYGLHVSKNGTIWMAMDNGIARIENQSPFSIFGAESGLDAVSLSMIRHKGKLYLGVSDGLQVFEPSTRRFEYMKGLQSYQVFNLVKDGDRLLTSTVGINEVVGKTVRNLTPGYDGMSITIVHPSAKHPGIYYGGGNGGIEVFRRNKAGLLDHLGPIPNLNDQFWTFLELPDGRFWAGTQNGSVFLMTPAVDAQGNPDLSKYSYRQYGEADGLINGIGQVNEFNGEPWFITDSAFFRFDEKKQRFYQDTLLGFLKGGGGIQEGDIINDANGRYWVRLGRETYLFTPDGKGGYIKDKSILLPINDRAFSRIYPDGDSITWICTSDGLIRFDEKLKKDYRTPFKTYLRTVRSGNQAYTIDPVAGQTAEVPAKHSSLRFDFATPFYDQEDKTLYQTWLEGFEEGWSDWQKSSYKEYTNLPQGNYTFHVRAKNVYEHVSEEAVYSFQILPFGYQTWWAYLLYALLAAALLYLFIRSRTRQLQESKRELEKTISERTRQLSDRLDELAIINSVQEGLVRELNPQAIYKLVGDKIRGLFNAKVLDITSYDSTTGLLTEHYSFEDGKEILLPPSPLQGFRKHVVETKQPLLIKTNAEEASRQYQNKLISGNPIKSALFVPIVSANTVTGVISVQDTEKENAFDEADLSLLTTLSNSMSVAIQNANKYEETRTLLEETEKGKKNVELLSDIGKKITSSLDFETIFVNLYEHINQLADASIFGVGIYHPERDTLEYQFAMERGKRYQPYTRSTRDKNQFPVWCIDHRQPVVINDVAKEYSRYISQYEHKGYQLEDGSAAEAPASMLYLPLLAKDAVLGIITIQSFEKNAYTPYHLNLLQNLATFTSIALDNAGAYQKINEREQEIAQRAAEMSTVNNISQALAGQIDLDSLIHLVGEQMRSLFNANITYLALLDKKTNTVSFPYQHGDDLQPMRLGDGLTSKIILQGKPLLINREVGASTDALGVSRIGIPAASYLGVPIFVGDEVIGVLSVQSTEKENRFTEKDERLLSTIAANVGVAIRKARLFEEIKTARQEAESARKVAEQANAAKSAFLSTVSHELRTPLTSVLGFAKIIKKRLEERIFPVTDTADPRVSKSIEQVSDNLNVVVAEGQRLTHLINDVLDLAKIEAGKMEWNMEETSLKEVTERAIAATTALFDQKSLKLELQVEDPLPNITGDRDKLIQVVVNLLSNAVKFTDHGTVHCRIRFDAQRGEVVTSITDTGIGIAAKDHAAVFEQFKQVGDTLTDKPKGTGLGLPICKEIVEHHGGHIWLESEIGEGSTFFFSIPVSVAHRDRPLHFDDLVRQLREQMKESEIQFKNEQAVIMVVDDDDSIRSLLRQEFSEAGYKVREAVNGKEALHLVREEKPDLIILDIMMPEMNGFDVAAILKNDPQTMDIPIIVLSIVQDKARGMRIGVDRYLTKPIDTNLLFKDVGNLLEQGKSRKRVMVVDEDKGMIRTLAEVLQERGYQVVESDTHEIIEKAIATKPDIIILNSLLSGKQDIVKTLRFEKGLERVLFLIYQ